MFLQCLKNLVFPILKRIVAFALRSKRLQREVYEYAASMETLGKPTFLSCFKREIDNDWRIFFRNRTYWDLKCCPMENLLDGLDDLSKEVVLRLYYSRLLYACLGSCWASGIPESLGSFFPLDKKEQERLSDLGQSYVSPWVLPNICKIPSVYMATHFGLSYFPNDVQKHVVGKDVIDGGGYSGDSAMVFTEFNPRMVYAFEPNPDMVPEMRKIIQKNGVKLGEMGGKEQDNGGVTPVQLALGAAKGSMKLYSTGSYDCCATGLNNGSEKNRTAYDVSVVSIDDYVREHALNIGLIKLDVEGVESDVIEGAIETIKNQKPLLIISIYHTPKDFFEIKSRIEHLNIGYRFMVRHLAPEYPLSDTCLLGWASNE